MSRKGIGWGKRADDSVGAVKQSDGGRGEANRQTDDGRRTKWSLRFHRVKRCVIFRVPTSRLHELAPFGGRVQERGKERRFSPEPLVEAWPSATLNSPGVGQSDPPFPDFSHVSFRGWASLGGNAKYRCS